MRRWIINIQHPNENKTEIDVDENFTKYKLLSSFAQTAGQTIFAQIKPLFVQQITRKYISRVILEWR